MQGRYLAHADERPLVKIVNVRGPRSMCLGESQQSNNWIRPVFGFGHLIKIKTSSVLIILMLDTVPGAPKRSAMLITKHITGSMQIEKTRGKGGKKRKTDC